MRKNVAILILAGLLAIGAGCPVFGADAASAPASAGVAAAKVGADPASLGLRFGEAVCVWEPPVAGDTLEIKDGKFTEEVFFRAPAGTETVNITLYVPDADEGISYDFVPENDCCAAFFRCNTDDTTLHKASLRVEFLDEDGNLEGAADHLDCYYSDDLTLDDTIGATEESWDDLGADLEEPDEDWAFAVIPLILIFMAVAAKAARKETNEDAAPEADDETSPDSQSNASNGLPEDAGALEDAGSALEDVEGLMADVTDSDAKITDDPSQAPEMPVPTPTYENPFESGDSWRCRKDNPFEL